MFEYFIRTAIIDRYNIRCYITAHEKQQPTYIDGEISAGGRSIT